MQALEIAAEGDQEFLWPVITDEFGWREGPFRKWCGVVVAIGVNPSRPDFEENVIEVLRRHADDLVGQRDTARYQIAVFSALGVELIFLFVERLKFCEGAPDQGRAGASLCGRSGGDLQHHAILPSSSGDNALAIPRRQLHACSSNSLPS